MNDPNRDRWNVARWRQALERIEAHDEGGMLGLTTEMDEFCDEVIALHPVGHDTGHPGGRSPSRKE